MRIKKVSEADFDVVVKEAGGSRINKSDSADYILNEAVMELKLAEEEGFEVRTRQEKIAEIFKRQQPQSPVVVIRPNSLNEADKRAYYNAVAGPLEDDVEKGAKQLEKTALRFDPQPVRVLIILNIGYTALSVDEFKDICIKCAHKRNYNGRIDWLICGGIYFASDKAENYVISTFVDIPINVSRSFPSAEILRDSWQKFVSRTLLESLRQEIPDWQSRLPALDLVFEIDGVRYVKPSPKTPKSGFWPSGQAPRENTTNIEHAYVALTFPSLSEAEWNLFKKSLPTVQHLQTSYKEWLEFLKNEESNLNQLLEPFVPVPVKFEEFVAWVSKPISDCQFSDVCKFATEMFHLKGIEILQRSKDKAQITIIAPESIYLAVSEIGQDEANDLSSIYYISEIPGFKRKEVIVENEKLFFSRALSLATSYAIKRNVDVLVYSKQRL